jgi:hypothetical protein
MYVAHFFQAILNCTRTMWKNERQFKAVKPPATKNRPAAVGFVTQAVEFQITKRTLYKSTLT